MTDPVVPPSPAPEPVEPSAPAERRSVKLSPKLVLLLLIGSCYAFGYTIYLLLKGMHR